MAKFDRSAFKATQVSTLKQQQEAVEQQTDVVSRGNAEWIKLEEGTNKLRFYPAHPGYDNFIYPRSVHFLPIEVENKDGEREVKRIPVFSSKVHGGTEMCVVDRYIFHAFNSVLPKVENKKEREDKAKAIKNWKTGILGRTKWIAYVDLIEGGKSHFGKVELASLVKESMNEMAIIEDSDEPIETDPFTDPDEGKAVIVTYNPDAKKPQDYYSCAIDFRKDYPLSDDQLSNLLEHDPLAKSVGPDVYKASDFEKALEGLKRFDEENELGVFAVEEFLDECETISNYYPEVTEEDEEHLSKMGRSDKGSRKEPTDISQMDMDQLKKYIKNNDLNIRVLSRYTEDDVRDIIIDEERLQSEKKESEEEDSSAVNTAEKLPWDKEDSDPKSSSNKNKSRLEKLRELQQSKEE